MAMAATAAAPTVRTSFQSASKVFNSGLPGRQGIGASRSRENKGDLLHAPRLPQAGMNLMNAYSNENLGDTRTTLAGHAPDCATRRYPRREPRRCRRARAAR